MPYKIAKHYQRGNSRVIVVDTGKKDAKGEPITEIFTWGMDVPLEAVKRETRLLMDAKAEQNEVVLTGLGNNL